MLKTYCVPVKWMEEAKMIGVLVRHGENDYELLAPEDMPDFEFDYKGISIRGTLRQIAELVGVVMGK